MPLSRNDWSRVWTCAMAAVALGLMIYLSVYVCRRVGIVEKNDAGTVISTSTGDWVYYYTASQAMLSGEDIYNVKAVERGRAGYIYPPMMAFLYQPLARLGYLPGARGSLFIDEFAVAGALAVAAKALLERLGKRSSWEAVLTVAVMAALVSSDKIKGELQMLQCNGLVALGIALGLWLLDRKPGWAGFALGFAINIKYQALGLVLYLVFRRRWKPLGWTAVGTAFWAFLPALSVGFVRDCDYLVRGFAGVLRLVGFETADHVANIMPLSAGESISITSAAARFTESHHMTVNPFILAGAVAGLWLLTLFLIYRNRRVPALAWPTANGQRVLPWLAAVGVDWMAVIGSVLAFSPETNSRHLLQTALINVLGVVLVLEARRRARWVALAGLVILWMGLNLPPGNRAGGASADYAWRTISGPTWSILLTVGLFTWSGLTLARQKSPAPSEPSAAA